MLIERRSSRLAGEALLLQFQTAAFADPLELLLDRAPHRPGRAERLRPHLVDADVGD